MHLVGQQMAISHDDGQRIVDLVRDALQGTMIEIGRPVTSGAEYP